MFPWPEEEPYFVVGGGACRGGVGGKEPPETQPSSCKASSAFSPGRSPSDGRSPATSLPRQEPTAEPDQLVRPLRTSKWGFGTPPSGPWARKDSWAGGSREGSGSRGLCLRWGPRKPAAAGGEGCRGEGTGGHWDQEIKGEMENSNKKRVRR